MTSATKDPFDQLVDACREALTFVSGRAERAGQEVARRQEQSRRIEGALAVLAGDSAFRAAPIVTRTGKRGPRADNGRCPKCGHGYRSAEHKICREADAPGPLVLNA